MNIINKVEKILKQGNIAEFKAEAKLLVCGVSGLSLEEIILKEKIPEEEKIIELALKRAQTHAPIQHLIGFSDFMGEKYIVNKNVLIPRDETEFLVNRAFELLKNKTGKINILDIGIGSGCISCALAKKMKNYDIEILGVDISLEALQVAIENINKLDLIRKVVVRKSDLFSKIRECEKFDLIVSNPPYIPILEKNDLQFEVKNFDPELALFAPDEKGIDFYRKIIELAPEFLKEEGFLAFEVGINQKDLVFKMMEQDFKEIEAEKDLAGIERVIWGKVR